MLKMCIAQCMVVSNHSEKTTFKNMERCDKHMLKILQLSGISWYDV